MATGSLEAVATGIRGLDAILDGGFLQGCVYILRGRPGTGKTILANQICFDLAARGAACTYFSVLAEASDRMVAQQSQFRFFRPELVGANVYYVAAYRVLEEGGLAGLLEIVRTSVANRPAKLLVLDGLQTVRESARSEAETKRFVHDLQALAMLTQSVVLLLCGADPNIEVEPEHTVADGIIELTEDVTDMRALRHVHVRKMRGAGQVRGKHTMTISDAGITVMPRAETRPRLDDVEVAIPNPSKRVAFKIDKLDRMLGGGLPERSITMLVGPTGCGKTTLGVQFVVAGAAAGEPSLYFGFYERPPELFAKTERVGIPVGKASGSGKLHVVWQAPVEGILDILADRLLSMIEQHRIRRLCIDGIHTFGRTIDYPHRVPDALAALQSELQKLNVTTVYTLETRSLFSTEFDVPINDVSATSHNIILLRYIEADAQMHRLISVIKVRECAHDMRAYEFKLTDRGIVIEDKPESASAVLGRRGRGDV